MIFEPSEHWEVETPLGKGNVLFIEPGTEDTEWTVALKTGAVVSFKQNKILMGRSFTEGRRLDNTQMRDLLDKAIKGLAKSPW